MPQAAFDPKKYVSDNASSFDPKAYVAAANAPQQPKRVPYTEGESALRGIGQGLYGASDEVIGGLKAIGKRVLNAEDQPATGLFEDFRKERSAERLKDQQAERDNPKSFIGGNLFGGVVGSFIPVLGTANAAKIPQLAAAAQKIGMGSKVTNAIGRAIAGGALYSAGASNADLTKGELKDFAGDVATGAAISGGLQAVGSGIGSALSGAVRRFKNIPAERAVKAVTGNNSRQYDLIMKTKANEAGDIGRMDQRLQKVGRDLLDERLITESGEDVPLIGMFSSVEDTGRKLKGIAKDKYGKIIGEIGKTIDERVPASISGAAISQDILAIADKIPDTTNGKALRAFLEKHAKDMNALGDMTFERASGAKDTYRWNATSTDAVLNNQKLTNQIKGTIADHMERAAKKLADESDSPEIKELLSKYKWAKGKYDSFINAANAAAQYFKQQQKNRFSSASDYGLGATIGLGYGLNEKGFSPEAFGYGLVGAGANKLLRERGSAFAARTADMLVKAFESGGVQELKKAASPLLEGIRRGNPAAMATFQLLRQSDPRAAEILNEQSAMQRKTGGK